MYKILCVLGPCFGCGQFTRFLPLKACKIRLLNVCHNSHVCICRISVIWNAATGQTGTIFFIKHNKALT